MAIRHPKTAISHKKKFKCSVYSFLSQIHKIIRWLLFETNKREKLLVQTNIITPKALYVFIFANFFIACVTKTHQDRGNLIQPQMSRLRKCITFNYFELKLMAGKQTFVSNQSYRLFMFTLFFLSSFVIFFFFHCNSIIFRYYLINVIKCLQLMS